MRMEEAEGEPSLRGGRKLAAVVLLCVICVAVNYIGSQIAAHLDVPFYFDCLGIILAAAFGGYIPGIAVGYVTNLITTAPDPASVYYCLTSVLIAEHESFSSHSPQNPR